MYAYRWPFDGVGTPDWAAACFAEIFPSLVHYPEWETEYTTARDLTQVRSCIRRAAERDGEGVLRADFDRPGHRLDAATLAGVEDEEGWILWV